jgi:cytochrome bd-type quinol oxidase subunit 2
LIASFDATIPIFIVLARAYASIGGKAEAAPFFGATGLFVLAYIGMAISLYPMIVPYQLTLWGAGSSPRTRISCTVAIECPVIAAISGTEQFDRARGA